MIIIVPLATRGGRPRHEAGSTPLFAQFLTPAAFAKAFRWLSRAPSSIPASPDGPLQPAGRPQPQPRLTKTPAAGFSPRRIRLGARSHIGRKSDRGPPSTKTLPRPALSGHLCPYVPGRSRIISTGDRANDHYCTATRKDVRLIRGFFGVQGIPHRFFERVAPRVVSARRGRRRTQGPGLLQPPRGETGWHMGIDLCDALLITGIAPSPACRLASADGQSERRT